jgi:hypothetical protein
MYCTMYEYVLYNQLVCIVQCMNMYCTMYEDESCFTEFTVLMANGIIHISVLRRLNSVRKLRKTIPFRSLVLCFIKIDGLLTM